MSRLNYVQGFILTHILRFIFFFNFCVPLITVVRIQLISFNLKDFRVFECYRIIYNRLIYSRSSILAIRLNKKYMCFKVLSDLLAEI